MWPQTPRYESKMSSSSKQKIQPVQVFVRVRPLNKQEGHSEIIECRGPKEIVINHLYSRTYHFDRVFPSSANQVDVYKLVAEPTVAEVIAGYNCTVLAYGQTGTGKTYTMAGGSSSSSGSATADDIHAGIIPRTLGHLFDELRLQQLEYTVRVSYLELYNEEIFDLLSAPDDTTKLKLYDDSIKKGSVIIQGLTETTVHSKADVYKVLNKGSEKRRIASTLMNAQSSRSHTVFCITVHTKENTVDGEDLLKTGKLYLVDLAGSENIKQSGATDIRAREAFNINQSLLTLGRCIKNLTERASHIPYRESKLTRILQDSFGGRTKTTLIATISPAACSVDETSNTLDYAFRAKSITNRPEINQKMSKQALLKEYTEEIERLRKDLTASRKGQGIFLDVENYRSLTEERELHKAELSTKIMAIRVLEEEMAKKEELLSQLKFTLDETKKMVEEKTSTINALQGELTAASSTVEELSKEKEISTYIVTKYVESEKEIKNTARTLITVADTVTSDTKKLHDKLETLDEIQKHNKKLCETQVQQITKQFEVILNNLKRREDTESNFHTSLGEILASVLDTNESYKKKLNEAYLEIDRLRTTLAEVATNKSTELNEKVDAMQSRINNLKDETERNLNTSLQTLNLGKLKDMQESIDEFDGLLFHSIQKAIDMNNDHSMETAKYLKETKEKATEVRETLLEHYNNISEIVSHSLDQVEKSKAESEYLDNRFQAKFEELNEIAKEMKNFHIRHANDDVANIQTINQRVEECSRHTKDVVDDFVSHCQTFATFTETTISTNEDTLMGLQDERQDKYEWIDALRKEVVEKIEETRATACTNLTSINDTCSSNVTDCKITTSKLVTEIEKLDQELLESNVTSYDNANTLLNDVINLLSSASKHNETCVHESSSINSNITANIHQCAEDVKNRFAPNLMEYRQTGLTPQRRTYKYPKQVNETQTPEQYKEEFLQLQTLTEEIDKEANKENPPSNEVPKGNLESRAERILKSDENRPAELILQQQEEKKD